MRKIIFKDEILSNLDYEARSSIVKFLNLLDELDLDIKKKLIIRESFLNNFNSYHRIAKQQIQKL